MCVYIYSKFDYPSATSNHKRDTTARATKQAKEPETVRTLPWRYFLFIHDPQAALCRFNQPSIVRHHHHAAIELTIQTSSLTSKHRHGNEQSEHMLGLARLCKFSSKLAYSHFQVLNGRKHCRIHENTRTHWKIQYMLENAGNMDK